MARGGSVGRRGVMRLGDYLLLLQLAMITQWDSYCTIIWVGGIHSYEA